ncbi:hypothetical protein B9J78_05000 [bacterium Unc6]|nr:hypothetical protein [bacterium Unc6]
MGKAKADILIYGHTHIPYRRDLGGKVFINAGSVGKPKDGDTRACLTLVECLLEDVKTGFISVPYDVEKVASAITVSACLLFLRKNFVKGNDNRNGLMREKINGRNEKIHCRIYWDILPCLYRHRRHCS